MLKTRIITALVLLAVVLVLLFLNSFTVFALTAIVFFIVAIWESFRLFGSKQPMIGTVFWACIFGLIAFKNNFFEEKLLFAICCGIWFLRLIPSLAIGLPSLHSVSNRLLNGIYEIAILGCFIAILSLFRHSALTIFSVMSIVWIADIGAYFAGKRFGKHKLAPSISPGKSWEGAIGGWLAVLIMATVAIFIPDLADTFLVKLYAKMGWPGFVSIITLLVIFSIAGDLFESQLKRRIGMKDSSHLLPGHGGVLDRIDALIPTLPLAAFVNFWL
jgi:phosphatidate cytidylyltransferase